MDRGWTKTAEIAPPGAKFTASATAEKGRSMAAALVEVAEGEAGARMAAYEAVAHSIGVTASWIRKLVGRQPIKIEAHEYLNIVSAYARLCERIEADAELKRQRAAALRKDAHAALASAVVVVARPARPDRG